VEHSEEQHDRIKIMTEVLEDANRRIDALVIERDTSKNKESNDSLVCRIQKENNEFKEILLKQVNETIDPFADLRNLMQIISINLPEITKALSLKVKAKKSNARPKRKR
jgi:hypothetical protein